MSDPEQDFEDFLEQLDREVDNLEDPREGVMIDRDLARLRRLEREEVVLNDFVRREAELLRQFAEDRQQVIARARTRIEARLEGWARAMHKGTGQLTWRWPHGTVRLREAQIRAGFEQSEEATAQLLDANGYGWLVQEVVTHRVPKDRVKQEVQVGDEILDWLGPPPEPGYTLHRAVIVSTDAETGEQIPSVLPGVILEVPVQRRFTVNLGE